MRIALVFPPQWTAAHPYAAMAALNGELRRDGHDVVIRDYNVALWHHLLDRRTLRLSRRRLTSEIQALTAEVKLRLATDDLGEKLQLSGGKLQALEAYADRIGEDVDALSDRALDAADTLRDRTRFFEPRRFMGAMGALDESFLLYSRPYYPAEMRWNDFFNPAVPLNFQPMLEFCDEPLRNPFRRYFELQLDELLETEADLIAISIGSFSQVLPGLTLARLLKAERDRRRADNRDRSLPHITLGGNFFTRLLEPLCKRPAFFTAFCDSLVIGEGEAPVCRLAQTLDPRRGGRDLSKVPNLLYLEGDGVVWTGEGAPRKMMDAAFLDLTGFPLDKYLSPDVVLCIGASKGCYYGECAFCDSHYGLALDELHIDRLVEHIRTLKSRHGVRHFEFIDQCISPGYMRRMCEAFIAADLDVNWFCNARTEAGFTPDLLRLMKRAGATMVMWGVESGSPRLLKLMRKGISPSERLNVLSSASHAGLWNFAYVFFGFPSETEDEAMQTVRLLRDHGDVIHSYGRSVFTLGRHCPMMAERNAFGILSLVEDNQEFSTNLTYRTAGGLQAEDLADISARCKQVYRDAFGDPLWMALRSRENLHLYLAQRGADYVRKFSFDDEPAVRQGAEFIF